MKKYWTTLMAQRLLLLEKEIDLWIITEKYQRFVDNNEKFAEMYGKICSYFGKINC